jgi:hypothetical protein
MNTPGTTAEPGPIPEASLRQQIANLAELVSAIVDIIGAQDVIARLRARADARAAAAGGAARNRAKAERKRRRR